MPWPRTKSRGWWFDGCYYADRMYRHPEAPNFKSFGAAARAGNPWDTPIAGRVSLSSATLEFPDGPVQDYALAPGETVARTVPVSIRDTTTPCFQFTVSRTGIRPSTYPFAVQWELAPEPLAANAGLKQLLTEVGVTTAPEAAGPFVRGRLFGNYDTHLMGSQGFARLSLE